MRKFVLIDHSLQDLRGHHFPYAASVMQAGAAAQLEVVLATHRGFSAAHELAERGAVHALFPAPSYSPHTLDTQSPRRSVDPLAPAGLGTWWRARGATRARARLRAGFAAACAQLFARVPLAADDIVFLATASELDLAGLADYVAEASLPARVHWHLQFHFGVFRGREPEYARQRATGDAMRASLAGSLDRLTGKALHFWCTTDNLTAQYNSLGVAAFATLPYPVHALFSAPQPLRPSPQPARIACLGHARREKGQGVLPTLLALLWQDHLQTGRARFVVQGARPDLKHQLERAVDQLGRTPGVIEFAPGALDLPRYAELVRASDVGLLLYDAQRYYDRCSGILLEMLSAGVPVVVPAASWLAQQIHAVNQNHLGALRHAPASPGLPLRLEDGRAVSALRLQHEPLITHSTLDAPGRTLLLSTRCLAPLRAGSYLRLELRQDGAPDTAAVQIVPARSDEELLCVAFRLNADARTLELHWSNAFGGEELVLTDLHCHMHAEALPLGAVGHAVADTPAAAAALRDILDHLDHYKRQSAQFAVSCAQRSSAAGIVAALIAVSRS